MCVGQERSAASGEPEPQPLRVLPLLAIPNANERGPHEMVDLVSVNGRQRTVWGSVHVDFFDLYRSAPDAYAALRDGKSLACELRILQVES